MNSETNRVDFFGQQKVAEQWCQHIVHNCYRAIGINVAILIIIWYFFVFNIFTISPVTYWLTYIIFPSIGMLIANFSVDRLIKNYRFSLRIKAYAALMLIVLLCTFLCILHSIISVLLMTFVIPIFISTIFVDMKITKNIFISSQLAQIGCAVKMSFFSTRAFGDWIWLELIVSSGILIVSFFMAKTLLQSGQYNVASLIRSNNDRQYLKEQVRRDSLTGLYNRKAYDEIICKAITESKTLNNCLSVAMLDVDNFKKVNDVYGHVIGDKVLLQLAHILLNNSNEKIYAFRLGGEEFALILKDYCVEDAYNVCEGIRGLMASVSLPELNNKKATFSCGIACMNKNFTDAMSLYRAADEALYKAKNTGKNKTMLFDGDVECIHPHKEAKLSERLI